MQRGIGKEMNTTHENELSDVYQAVYTAFPTEKDAIECFISLVYPHGLQCPYCGSTIVKQKRCIYWCSGCYYNFSIFHKTIFWHSRLDLRYWFFVICLILIDDSVHVTDIKKQLDISYKSAWRLKVVVGRALIDKNYQELFGKIYHHIYSNVNHNQ
jgi:transposase-like protein